MKSWFVATVTSALTWALLMVAALAQVNAPASTAISAPELDLQLRTYEQRVVARAAADRRSAIELLREVRAAAAEGKSALVIGTLEILAGKDGGRGEGGSRTWLRLALAWQAQSVSKRATPPAEAMAAAYGAYRRAVTDPERIDALSLLGHLLLQNTGRQPAAEEAGTDDERKAAGPAVVENWEAAKRIAYKVFTELGRLAGSGRFDAQIRKLQIPDFALVKATYPPPPQRQSRDIADADRCDAAKAKLDAAAGPVDGTVAGEVQVLGSKDAACKANTKNYACLDFSHNLDSNLEEVARKIAVERMDTRPGAIADRALNYPAAIDGKAVCYANLRFGGHYKFTVDKSLRAAGGESLKRAAVAFLQMPDYAPSLGFKRGTYVLPAKGPGSIAMLTVNVRSAKLMVRRIGDRNLVRQIVMKNIVGGLDAKEACFILKEIGEQIAEGEAVFKSEPNESTQYLLPIGALLEERRKWLQTSQQGGQHEYKTGNMSFRLFADQASAALAAVDQAGVFAVFGTITGEVAAFPDYGNGDDECDKLASQWFSITNVGLTLQRSSAKIYVIARALDSGAAIPGVTLEFVSRSGARLISATTGADGVAEIPARMGRGTGGNALVAVMAHHGRDFTFLDLTGDMVDLTDRGFEGSGPAGEYNAFVAPSRGIYRPGEKIEAVVLVRGRNGELVSDLPSVDVQLVKSDGSLAALPVTFDRSRTDFSRDGGFFVELPLPKSMLEGSLTLEVKVLDRKIGSAPIEVRYYQPHTVRIVPNENSWSGTIDNDNLLKLSGKPRAEYLYGVTTGSETDAPAANLRGDVAVRIEAASSPLPGCFEDFAFGQRRGELRTQLIRGAVLSTDAKGLIGGPAGFVLERAGVSPANIPQRASVKMTLLDLNGKAAEREFKVPLVHAGRRWIGVKSLGAGDDRPGQPTRFAVILLDDKNQPVREQLQVRVFRELSAFVWYQDGNAWDFVTPANAPRTLVREPIRVESAGPAGGQRCPLPATLTLPFEQTGSYIVQVTDREGTTTELAFGYGWTTAPDGGLKPDALRVFTQRTGSFAPGEVIEIGMDTPHKAGKVFGQLTRSGEIVHKFEADINNGRADARVPVARAWSGPMHIYATSFRKAEDDSIEQGPGRAIGGTTIRISDGTQSPSLRMTHPEKLMTAMLGERPVRIEIALNGLERNAWVAVAAVDEGILAITDFKTPNPVEHYFGPRRFDFDVFDTYGRILYGRFGGGDLLRPLGTSYQHSDVVVWHSKILRAVDGRLTVEIPADRIPKNFQGEVRLMAWAWDARNMAVAQGKIDVRDPIIVQAGAPRVLSPGDTALVPVRASNLEIAAADRVTIDVQARGSLVLTNDPRAQPAAPCGTQALTACRRLVLDARRGQPPTDALVAVRAADDGDGTIELSYDLPGRPVNRSWRIPVRAPYPTISRVVARALLAPGASYSLTRGDFERAAAQGLSTGSLRMSVAVARSAMPPTGGFDVAERETHQLDQLAASVQLMLAEGQEPGQPVNDAVAAQLTALIGEIIALQDAGGQFLANGRVRRAGEDGGTLDLGQTAFALDVLARAKAAGIPFDHKVIDRAAGFLLSSLRGLRTCTRSESYALAVLAKLDLIGGASFRSAAATCARLLAGDVTGKVMLSSAYSAFGFIKESQDVLGGVRPEDLPSLGSEPAEAARTAALVLENAAAGLDVQKLLVKAGLSGSGRTENLTTASWLMRAAAAASAILGKNAPPFSARDVAVAPAHVIERVVRDGIAIKRIALSELPPAGVQIANRGSVTLQASLIADGVPAKINAENATAFRIAVAANGANLDPARPLQFKQFETVYFTVAINQADNYKGKQRLGAVAVMPSGFEGVHSSYDYSWSAVIGSLVNASAFTGLDYTEFHDDRWIVLPTAVEGPQHHLLGFSLRPTMKGDFVFPPLVVRDLNNPERMAWTKPLRVQVLPAE